MTKIKDITSYLESIAPLSYQESYDNAGLIVGSFDEVIRAVLISLDCTEEVVEEAIVKKCNLIIAHHPIVFKGLKKLNGSNYVERTVIKAIKNNIAIYAIHTNLDNIANGVNWFIANRLNLNNIKILAPKHDTLMKLVSFVPIAHSEAVLDELYKAGAGQIGNYSHCSFSVEGKGKFRPNEQAIPFIGHINRDEIVQENRIEVIFPAYLQSAIVAALHRAHPYEEVAHYVQMLHNINQEVGAGAIGTLINPMETTAFLSYLQQKMNLKIIRHTKLVKKSIQQVAVCGGAGGFLLKDAIRQKADIFITADYKYHEFFDADGQIIICDIGHYESEVFTKELLQQNISRKFTNFAAILSETNTNPVCYFDSHTS